MMRLKPMSIATAVALSLCVTPNVALAQSQNLKAKVQKYFLQTLQTKQADEMKSRDNFVHNTPYSAPLQVQIKVKDVGQTQKMVWDAWCAANNELQEQKLLQPQSLKLGGHSTWNLPASLEPNAVLPYYYGSKGVAQGKLPLFLYLHGSGPKEQEWQTGLALGNLFQDAPSLYFIPQIPNEGEYYRWWQLAKQFAWEKLLRQALIDNNVDANRLYVFGISEGGYGSQRLASFYADYWAAAGPMAGGEPLKNAPVENCANMGFSFLTGADDTGFYRNILTYYTQVAFDSAQLSRPLSVDKRPLFVHRINLLPGMQHRIDYRLTTPWLKNFVRNAYPKTVLWEDFEMDGRRRNGFYNLQVMARPSENRTYYEMEINNNVVKINVSDVKYTCVEQEKQWGIEMKFSRSYAQAKGGRLRVYLNQQLVDLNKPVTVIVNGRQVYRKIVQPSLQDMVNSCVTYFDPYRVYPASVEVSY